MSELHLVRMLLDPPRLMAFANGQGLLRYDDEGHGYVLHAWLSAMFGTHAPKPFRWDERQGQLLGYSRLPATVLTEHAQSFAQPQEWAALVPDSLLSKPMATLWRSGQRLQADVLACPVSRRDDGEKDVFLRAVDRFGDTTPPRAHVYADWFRRQWKSSVAFEKIDLVGFSRMRVLRRGRRADGARTALAVERPQALFRTLFTVQDGAEFGDVISRGIGRHRAFGYGMVLLRPAP